MLLSLKTTDRHSGAVGHDLQSHILSRQRNAAPEKGSIISYVRISGGEVLLRNEKVITREENRER